MNRIVKGLSKSVVLLAVLSCSACAVVAVADAVVVVGATVVKTGVKATGAVIGALIPDSKHSEK